MSKLFTILFIFIILLANPTEREDGV